MTLAAYALAYATLAGRPAQVGIYGYMLGGLGYSLLGSSRQLAIGPTSAISLMLAATVTGMAAGDAQRYAQVASLAGFTVAGLCLIAWALRLSALVKLISDSILVGFKAGAGPTIAITQLPSLFGVAGGGQDSSNGPICSRASSVTRKVLCWRSASSRSCCSCWASGCCRDGRSRLRSSCWPLSLLGCSACRRSECPSPERFRVDCRASRGLSSGYATWKASSLAAGCLLLAYIEGVSAARTYAAKHGYALDPRQELLGVGAANLTAALGHGYPVAGGLSQSAVNDKAGARTSSHLLFASLTLALCLLFLSDLLENLPKAVLAAVVLTAVAGLVDVPVLARMWRVSRIDFLYQAPL